MSASNSRLFISGKELILRKTFIVLCLILTCSLFTFAQDYSKADVFAGYQWTSVDNGSGFDRLNFNGWNGALTGYFNKNFGITADFAGAYKSESGASIKIHSFMFGPTLRMDGEKASPFVHALFGAAHGSAGFGGLSGTDNAFAYAFGGGVDWNASKSVAIRVGQFDYVGTRFGGENQKNFRYSGGVVFKF